MTYRIDRFIGLDQSMEEIASDALHSPDAVNVRTEGGGLSSAPGYEKYSTANLTGGIGTLCVFYQRVNGLSAPKLVAVNAARVATLNDGAWSTLYEGDGANAASALNYQSDGADILLLADGVRPVLRWDGGATAAALTGCPALFSQLALHYERVWGAGVLAEPDSVYWSRAFDPENWTGNPDAPDEGGGTVLIPTWNGGSVNALRTLFGDVLAFKDSDLFRIIGTYPGNYEISRVHGVVGPIAKNSIVSNENACFFLSRDGLCAYDGLTVSPIGNDLAKKVFARVNRDAASAACACLHKGTLYLALPLDDSSVNSAVLEIDFRRGAYILRAGVRADCFLSCGDDLLFSNDTGYVYRYGKGDLYDGEAKDAWWRTPWIDLGLPGAVKRFYSLSMYASGTFDAELTTDTSRCKKRLALGSSLRPVTLPLYGSGRRFNLKFSGVNGARFGISPGVTLALDTESQEG